MDGRRLLFSFRGRMSRRPYWLIALVGFSIMAAVALAFAMLATVQATPPLLTAMSIVAGLGVLAMVWIVLATTVKRLHDRDKSAWWLPVFLVLPSFLQSAGVGLSRVDPTGIGYLGLSAASLAVSIWALVELGFMSGTPGDNRYGPDPLGGDGAPSPSDGPPPSPSAPPAGGPSPPAAPRRHDPWRP